MSSTISKLTDHKVLIFDVYGTLVDWESGLYDALQPLLSQFPASRHWSRKEALTTFISVEGDLQAQYPDMLYSQLLAKPWHTKSLKKGSKPMAHRRYLAHAALRVLAEHFKLVVLSNVDRTSFRHTHALLSEGIGSNPDIALYTYPDDKPHKFWHPQATMGSQSPFTLILTAQDTGCYKPDLGGFNAALEYIRSNPALFGDLGQEDVRPFVLSVAQSLQHDHVAARRLGMQSVWIDRQSAVTCNELPRDSEEMQCWILRFETLGEMADAVKQASRVEQPVDDPAIA
ncbi:uncharacterized protein LACBIDRAFT_327188 [Laccaria bicolor S238N-H82]|uniref:Predicted protein n=1 Tax=Laccaria bicolor (strain S238N-H82 / ATCC MYA-4686) TaxID=486041 RepID=B0DBF0_LACBS|nr:uncharacterized protein LACBIDRAFT_327188 [Laccaria bicolor S238N-H82]EDR07982.1 predicted protein [Laccaria bicolor S238N-H82]|eukprot:XP_001881052.1 predicted protein [Laccaria bicolor S238N-H82]